MARANRIAFVCPRLAEGGTVGGAETLLRELARRAAAAGREVTFLTTCATNHFTWENERPAGERDIDGFRVIFFPVDEDRNVELFLTLQDRISRRRTVGSEEETQWLANSVNSRALCDHLRANGDSYDRIVTGPYLYGLVVEASLVHPDKTLLVPCLHDEPFAYLSCFTDLFRSVNRSAFNSAPERDLAVRLHGVDAAASSIVGLGLDPVEADADRARGTRDLNAPYVLYSGRREPLKGTPLLLDYLTVFRSRTERDIKVVLTGSGQVDPPRALRPHVLDLGFVSEQEKYDVMAGAVAFVHPSILESLGIVVLESWLAGTPALVHGRCAVLRDQCERSGGGLWFENYPEFEEELCLLLDDAPLRHALGEAGRRYVVSEYSWPEVEKRLLQALDS